jgi:Mg2+-importing ATPase
LKELVKTTTVFARLSPIQKERVVRALRNNGHIVGYMGDGINDAPSLKAADVGISVHNAVDIAKESADIILLQKSLLVLKDGVMEGRRVFGNILKYVKMGSSSNFGNMLSMTTASFLFPFLPMLPIQILLNNFLYDISQIAIASDDVDEEYLARSRPWNINYIKKFMIVFGGVSSIFDFVTFGVLWFLFRANATLFHTGWFMESLCTQTLVIHIIRTGKLPFLESRASQFLIFTSIYIVTIGLMIPYTPLGKHFGFMVPPGTYLICLVVIVLGYVLMVQMVKDWFIRKFGYE